MVFVDYYMETEQKRLATPCPHPTLPQALPVRPALPLVGPEVPSVFARQLPPSQCGRDGGEEATFSLQARRTLPVAVCGLERGSGPPPEFSDAPPSPLAARLCFALSRQTRPSVNSRHSVRC